MRQERFDIFRASRARILQIRHWRLQRVPANDRYRGRCRVNISLAYSAAPASSRRHF